MGDDDSLMEFAHEPIFIWLSQFAFQPTIVYFAVVVMMLLSAFGLPIPEEITLLSVGLLAFMGSQPDLFPPPYPGAPTVNPIEAAIVATFAVFAADFVVYSIGRKWGRKILTHPRLQRIMTPELIHRAEQFTRKYGMLATGIFRFTPGLRFPGHLLCGSLRLAPWRFVLVDLIAVSISVPTQILLLAYYGEPILVALKKFKIALFATLGVLFIIWLAVKLRQRFARKPDVKGT